MTVIGITCYRDEPHREGVRVGPPTLNSAQMGSRLDENDSQQFGIAFFRATLWFVFWRE
jgi:hypothetical protein